MFIRYVSSPYYEISLRHTTIIVSPHSWLFVLHRQVENNLKKKIFNLSPLFYRFRGKLEYSYISWLSSMHL